MTHNPSLSRRRFLQSSSAVAAGAVLLPASASALGRLAPDILVPGSGRFGDPDRHALATMAIEAARAAGASYADVRLSRTDVEGWSNPFPTVPAGQECTLGVGVRVLVNGFWGFLGSATWTPEEVVRLARGAVAQAKANSLGKTRETPLAAMPAVVNGQWTMPVKYDPFTVSYGEKYDFFNHIAGVLHRYAPQTGAAMKGDFTRKDVVFASSEGSSWSQITYLTQGGMGVGYGDEAGFRKFWPGQANATQISSAGAGWEYFLENGLLESVPMLVEQAEQMREHTPVDVGRYDLVCSAQALAAIVGTSVGAATELDRAMGYEANAEGTSYLDRPLEMLGTQLVGNKLLNVTAGRSQPGGAATVKWDDEGVAPEDFTLVKDGVLVDYQTTREQVEWIKPYYTSAGRPLRSHGCSVAANASQTPMQHRPNLQMLPAAKEASFDELVAGAGKGVALLDIGFLLMDPQQLNGTAVGTVREIKNGKLGRVLDGAALTFRAPEFWKSLDAIGGPSSVRTTGRLMYKGQPVQQTIHSISAVPGRFKNAGIIDFTRKA